MFIYSFMIQEMLKTNLPHQRVKDYPAQVDSCPETGSSPREAAQVRFEVQVEETDRN